MEFDRELPAWAERACATASTTGEDVDAALRLALGVGRALPFPGQGATSTRWSVLAGLARANVTVARVVEAHTDALAILHEADTDEAMDASGSTWGVFAAESPAQRLLATPDGAAAVRLDGGKPWCSLGGVLDAGLVTARDDLGQRRLFAVDLRHRGVTARPADGWVSRGLPTVVSVGIDFDDVPAHPVGDAGWYLERPGFAWGGIGVAACWLGAARGVADALPDAGGDDLRALALGRVDAALYAASCALADAARLVDAGAADAGQGHLLALRVRAVVADAAERVLSVVGHATGPAPLAFDEQHAAQMAGLQIYVRQHHAERDLAELGRSVGKLR